MPLSEEGTGATARAWLVMRTEEALQVLVLGPDQLRIVATARAYRAAVLDLGDGAEPGACGLADGFGLGEGLVATGLSQARS